MVLGRLGDGLYLFRRKPLPEPDVLPDDPAAFQMVRLPVHSEAQVMAGRGGIQHFRVDIAGFSHGERTLDDCPRMVLPVRLVEGRIPGDHLVFNVLAERIPDRFHSP